MADTTIGKKFESKFEQYWQESVPGAFIYRLYDTVRGQSGVNNDCDYICYAQGHCFLVECKEHTKNTFPFSAFSQYERLIKYKDLEGVHAGVVLWFRDHDRVVWVPIETFIQLKEEGAASFHVKMIDDPKYECLELPSKKLRAYMQTDYLPLVNYYSNLKEN